MRILSPHCGVAAETTSGGEVYERELLMRLARRHTVRLLLTGRARERAPEALWTIGRLPIRRGLRWWVAPCILLDRMREEPRPDLLRVHSLKFIGPSAWYARRAFWPDLPLVAHHHHVDPGGHRLERLVSNRMDRVIVGSQFALRQISDLGWRTDHVRVVPYGVDTERFRPRESAPALRRAYGLPAEGPIALYFGGLKPRKNLGRLLGVWLRALECSAPGTLVIAGGGPLLDSYRAIVRSRAIPRVHFTGYVSEQHKTDLYGLADLFVFPSLLEGFGLPVLEAMASGLPCLISTAADFVEWVDGGYALRLLTERDFWLWTDRLVDLLTRPDLRRWLGDRNRTRALTMTWDRCVEGTESVYQEVA